MKKTLYILGILLTGIVGSLLTWYIGCCSCSGSKTPTEQEAATVVEPLTTSYPFKIADANFNYLSQDNFNFYQDKDQIIVPVSEKIDTGITVLKDYLSKNNLNRLDITGLYTIDETNTTAFPNLGIARANAVKNYFIKHGVDSDNINLNSQVTNEMVADEQSVYNGAVSFHLYQLSDDELNERKHKLEEIHDHIVADPLLLHFDFGSKKLTFSDEERLKIQEIVTYIDHNHNAVLDVIGHSDTIGSAAKNTQLGLERANFVKEYLVIIGINPEQIKTSSEGPNRPIASNDTEEGRATNRRVEIILE